MRRVGDAAGGPVVVTFDCYGDWHGEADQPGFGEAFFHQHGIAAIHVMPAGNDWYNYPTTAAALAAVGAATAGASRVVAYGSSMGGYAAIRFADRIGADVVLALSPQYSIDPAKAPFETRWPQEARAIRWRPELDGPIAARAVPVVVYDDGARDRRHVRLIARDTPIEAIRMPYGAHPVGTVLLETGQLQPLVFAAVAGTLDAAAMQRTIVDALPRSPTWWAERARRAPAWRGGVAIAYARRGVALAPDHPLALHVLAIRLDRAKRYDEALPLHARVASISRRDPAYLRPYSFALAAAGDLPAALDLAREIVAADPGLARSHQWEAWLLARLEDSPAAIAAAERCVALDGTDRGYRTMLARLRHGRGVAHLHPQAGALRHLFRR